MRTDRVCFFEEEFEKEKTLFILLFFSVRKKKN